jgi:hypothetical protein
MRRKKRGGGAFGRSRNKPKLEPRTDNLVFDLTGDEFEGSESAESWTHTAPNFQERLKDLDRHDEWAKIWGGLAVRYENDSMRPHSVYEAIIRGNRGYVPIIVAATSPDGKPQIPGLLYFLRAKSRRSRGGSPRSPLPAGCVRLYPMVRAKEQR